MVDKSDGQKEFSWEALQRLLTKASQWQLALRGCKDLKECAHDLTQDFIFGKPVANGHFLFLGDRILAYIPGAVDPEKVLHRLVVFQARAWKRKCERCRSASCAIIDDREKTGERTQRIQEVIDPANPAEMLAAELHFEEILEQIEDPDTRRIFDLKFRHACSADEIAEEVGLTPVAVRQRIHREKRKLRAIFIPA